jgi:hypothetical protein
VRDLESARKKDTRREDEGGRHALIAPRLSHPCPPSLATRAPGRPRIVGQDHPPASEGHGHGRPLARASTPLALLLTLSGRAVALPGDPLGPEFQVNTYTTSRQGDPAVSPDGTGGFVVVWQSTGSSGTDTDGSSIQGQRYDSTGTPVGGEFQVNTYTTEVQDHPAVSPDGTGGFVVMWQSIGSSGTDRDGVGIQGQLFDSSGTPVGGEFQVNTYTTNSQRSPAVSPDGAGGFVVVWDSVGSSGTDTSEISIQGQRYEGSPTTTTSQPTTTTSTTTTLPSECATPGACDDANPCTDDACAGGQCQHADNAAPCDDGSVCTTGDACGNGVCIPGVPLDVSAVAGFVSGATAPPAACTADTKDTKRVRKVLKQLKAARKKLRRAAEATEVAKRDRQLAKAETKLAKAGDLLATLAPRLSAACHGAMADRVEQAQAQAGCLLPP